jgi:(p)ppGpp synthase/HD superfamily hydrolase
MSDLPPWVPDDRRKLSARFTDALAVAAEIHAGQRRKGSGPPYVAHLLGVTALAFDYGADEEEAIAALLHDAIEDAPPSLGAAGVREVIRSRYGERVLAIVEGCTDSDAVPKPSWRVRKVGYIDHLVDAGASVLLVSASDKLHNVRAITRDYRVRGDEVWRKFSPEAGKAGTIGYYRGLVTAFTARASVGTPAFRDLLSQLDAEVAELEALAGLYGQWPPPPSP